MTVPGIRASRFEYRIKRFNYYKIIVKYLIVN